MHSNGYVFFFFNDTATTEIYPLSLHDALPILRERERARGLAARLVAATRALGVGSSALVTDMNQPLGRAVGNALEVRESIDGLRGNGPADGRELTLILAARLLVLAGARAKDAAARVA